MQTTSSTYQTLLAGNNRKETRLIINDNLIFGEESLCSLSTSGALFGSDTLSFGGCISREIRVKFYPGSATIPRMAKLQPQIRLTDGTTTSEWIPKGTFYIDTREYDKETGTLTLTGYDAMLKAEATYIPAGEVGRWPLPMSTVASEICTLLGLTMDSRTSVRSDYLVQLPTGYSMREVLGGIAAAHAGNWIITDAGKLRLIKATDMISASTVTVGRNVVKYTDDQPFAAITHVEVDVSDELYVEAVASPDNGRLLRVSCPWGTQAIANNILSSLANFTYQPYEAEGAILDPAAEIGDKIAVNGITSYLAVQECTFNSLALSDIGAPSEDEIDHEYPYEAVGVREIKRKVNGVYAAMYVGPDSIVSRVEAMGDTVDALDGDFSELEQKVNGFTISVTNGTTSSIIKLMSGSTVISSQTISMSGLVTFTDLSTAGQTTINGANIMTGTISADSIHVNTVYYTYNNTDYVVLASTYDNGNVYTHLGSKNSIGNGTTQFVNLYGWYCCFGNVGAGDDLLHTSGSLIINTANRRIELPDYTSASYWDIGTEDAPFNNIYGRSINGIIYNLDLDGGLLYGYIDGTASGPRWIDANGRVHYIALE